MVNSPDGGVITYSEEDELSSEQLQKLMLDAAHCDFLERHERAEALAHSVAGCSSTTTLLPVSIGEAVSEQQQFLLQTQPTPAEARKQAPPIFSAYLRGPGWPQLAARNEQLRTLLDCMHARGLQVAAPPSKAALCVGDEAAHALPRVLLYAWASHQGGWLEGTVRALNDNPCALLDGEPINVVAYYEADDCEAVHALSVKDYAEPRCNGWLLFEPSNGAALAASRLAVRSLESRDYGAPALHTQATIPNRAALPRLGALRSSRLGSGTVDEAAPLQLEENEEGSTRAQTLRLLRGHDGSLGFSVAKYPRNMVDCVHGGGSAHRAGLRAADVIVAVNGEKLSPRRAAADALARSSQKTVCTITIVRPLPNALAQVIPASEPATITPRPSQSSTSRRRALFARTSLAGHALPPVFLLLGSQAEVDARMDTRLEEQAIITGTSMAALRRKMYHVMKIDLYIQAASGGFAGLQGGEVGGQLWTLQAKSSYFAMLFCDMVRLHEGWDASWGAFFAKRKVAATRLAFPRGGYQSDIFAALTLADAHSLLSALDIETEFERDGASTCASIEAHLLRIRSDDPRMVAAESVLNAVFSRLVRSLHASGGIFASGLTSAELDRGTAKLSVGPILVKEVVGKLNSRVGRRRLRQAKAATSLVDWHTEGPHARCLQGKSRAYSTEYVKATKRVLAWHLTNQGWKTVRLTHKLEKGEVAYTAVVELQTRIVLKAYHTSLSLCEKQKVFRAMAATEDVMQTLLRSKRLTVALDLQMAVAEELSYRLALRVSDAEGLCRDNFAYGQGREHADVEFNLERHKADSAGHGASRWLQHCQGCQFAFLGTHNLDGRQWSFQSACGFQFTSSATPAMRCSVCMLLYLLDMQGCAAEEAPLLREMAGGGGWSWRGGTDGCTEHFSTTRLPYESFNKLLHEDVRQANAWREYHLRLPPWPKASAHWHMFRHGHIIMALIFQTPKGELMRSSRVHPRTLESYRAHTGGLLSVLFDQAHMEGSVQERTRKTQCHSLARRIAQSAATVDEELLRNELIGMCETFGITPVALERAPAGLRQLILSGAAMYRPTLLSMQHIGILQQEFNRHSAGAPSLALESCEVELSTLVTSIETAGTVDNAAEHEGTGPGTHTADGAPSSHTSSGAALQPAQPDESDDNMEDEDSDNDELDEVGTQRGDDDSDDGDGEATVAGDVEELLLRWQDLYAEARANVADAGSGSLGAVH